MVDFLYPLFVEFLLHPKYQQFEVHDLYPRHPLKGKLNYHEEMLPQHNRLSLAIRAVALFCVVSGGLVMASALAATRYRRLYESVILKALGATRALIARSFAVEYALLGAVGGMLGTGLASALSWAVLTTVFDLSWSLQPTVLLVGLLLTISLTVMVGFLSTYRILGQPPLSVLRQE